MIANGMYKAPGHFTENIGPIYCSVPNTFFCKNIQWNSIGLTPNLNALSTGEKRDSVEDVTHKIEGTQYLSLTLIRAINP